MNAHSSDGRDGPDGVALTPVDPLFQVQLIVVGNIVILVAALIALEEGHFKDHSIPASFLIPELCIIALGCAAAYTNLGGRLLAWLGRMSYEPSEGMRRWMRSREPLLRVLVFAFTAVAVFALVRLVEHTGGIVSSPFVPFLTTPALFGPFVAKRKEAVMLIVVAVAVVVLVLTAKDHTKAMARCPTPGCKQTVADQAADNAPAAPAQWLYSSVTLIVVFAAGGISAARLGRERKLERWIEARIAEQKKGDEPPAGT